MPFWAWEAGRSLTGVAGIDLDERLGLVATQKFTFLYPDIEGSTAMAGRLGDAWARA